MVDYPYLFSFNTQPPEGGWGKRAINKLPKNCFNTQPPEGGWLPAFFIYADKAGFNTQPPEGGWRISELLTFFIHPFQHTAARRRLAVHSFKNHHSRSVSTHSRPKAAGCLRLSGCGRAGVSTHSRLKAAGWAKTSCLN